MCDAILSKKYNGRRMTFCVTLPVQPSNLYLYIEKAKIDKYKTHFVL